MAPAFPLSTMPGKLHPVVLCGGAGSRLWPMSRQLLPKQFLPLVSEKSLLQDTVLRAARVAGAAAPVVVSNHEHRFLVAEQLQEAGVKPGALILEPAGRNTAPAVTAAALHLRAADPDGLMLVLASDHAITDIDAFAAAVAEAARIARLGHLVTFGLTPTAPATGYGYIELGDALPGSLQGFRIRRFVEKPDLATAREYVASGRFLWNSGMFVFPVRLYLEELARLRPDILAATEAAVQRAARDLDFLRLDAAAFTACPAQSVDYAVMEKTGKGAVVKAEMGWSDVGSWSALWDLAAKDAGGNVARGDVELQDTAGSYIRADSRLVYVLGMKDVLVVETDDAVLVADRSRAEGVKDAVERLQKERRSEHVSHSRVYRPWGYYESVDAGPRFQVKRLMVKPGHALSLQRHRQRAEHWVVVSGKARVTRGDDVFDVAENESTYIPPMTKHRLENATTEPLLLVEVQSGSYLGEDDIERFEDRYDRS
jgi:mannose-1-phosphate guanylyltransferase/mannose-6-phosphate isomerase